jgi:hypothetical protein
MPPSLIGIDAEFLDTAAGLDARLGEMTRDRLGDPAGAALAVSDLNRGVAVGFDRLDLGHTIIRHVKHRHRDGPAILGEDASHADLASNKA